MFCNCYNYKFVIKCSFKVVNFSIFENPEADSQGKKKKQKKTGL
jgi:hypothetical protein